jgi:DNA-binding IclR family transcriptional regulator
MKLAADMDESAATALQQAIDKALRDYQEYGCATSFGEWQGDVNGIAVGFRSSGAMPALVINCGGPSSSLSKEFLLSEVKPRLVALARKLESSALA